MVKYLRRRGNFNMTPSDIKELENLKKKIEKYKKLDLKYSQQNKDNIDIIHKAYSNNNNSSNEQNTKVDYLKPPQEKIEEDINENNEEYEEIEEEVEEEVEEGEGEGEAEAEA